MKRFIIVVLLTSVILSSCVVKYIGSDTMSDTSSTIIYTSAERTEDETEGIIEDTAPVAPVYYNSSEKFVYPDITLDLSDDRLFNTDGLLFLPNTADTPAELYITNEKYYAPQYKNSHMNDAECDKIAEQFLDAIKNKDFDTLASLTGAGYSSQYDEGSRFGFFSDIEISDWKYTRLNEGMNIKYYSVLLDIKNSDNPRYPVGRSYWYLEIPEGSELAKIERFIPTNERLNQNRGSNNYSFGNKYADFAEMLIGWNEIGNGVIVPDELDIKKMHHSVYHLMSYFNAGGNSGNTLSQVNDFLDKAFGFKNGLPEEAYKDWTYWNEDYNIEPYNKFLADPEAKVFTCSGHGGNILAVNHLGTYYDVEKGTTRVLLALYSDFAFMSVTKIIEFTFEGGQENDIPLLISVNTAYNSGFWPVAAAM